MSCSKREADTRNNKEPVGKARDIRERVKNLLERTKDLL